MLCFAECKRINTSARRLFQPRPKTARHINQPPTLEGLIGAFYGSCAIACAFAYKELKAPNQELPDILEEIYPVDKEVEICTSVCLPPSFQTLTAKATSIESLLDKKYSTCEVQFLEESTKGQSSNPLWKQYKWGIISASNIHGVCTKVSKLTKTGKCESMDTLKSQMTKGNDDISGLAAIKYGRDTEPEAKSAYKKLLRDQHRNFSVTVSGLFVLPDKIYIGASPDGLVNCDCCGNGLLEVKCPLSVTGTKPEEGKLPYLKKETDGTVKLSRNHTYYSQMMAQMGVTQRKWCDFFVYSRHGYHLERIIFDEKKWKEMVQSVDYFMYNILAPHLITCTTSSNVSNIKAASVPPATSVQETMAAHESMPDRSSSVTGNEGRKKSKHSRRKRKAKKVHPLYICGECGLECQYPEEISDPHFNSVECDNCKTWYHWECVSYEATQEGQSVWYCKECNIHSRETILISEEAENYIDFKPVSVYWQKEKAQAFGLNILNVLPVIRPSQICISEAPTHSLAINGDGNCFFRSLSYFITGDEDQHAILRLHICKYITDNIAFFGTVTNDPLYVQNSKMMVDGVWATEVEVYASASMLSTSIFMYTPYERDKQNIPVYKWLCYSPFQNSPTIFKESGECLYMLNSFNHFQPVIRMGVLLPSNQEDRCADVEYQYFK